MKVGNWIKYIGKYPLTVKIGGRNDHQFGTYVSITIGTLHKILKVNTLMNTPVSYDVELSGSYFVLHTSHTDEWIMDLEKERLEKIKSIGL